MIHQIFIFVCLLLHSSLGYNAGRLGWNDYYIIEEVVFLVKLAQVSLIIFMSLAVMLIIYIVVSGCIWTFKKL